jgi:hypothetical protein
MKGDVHKGSQFLLSKIRHSDTAFHFMREFPDSPFPDFAARDVPFDLKCQIMGVWKTSVKVCYVHRRYSAKPSQQRGNVHKANVS